MSACVTVPIPIRLGSAAMPYCQPIAARSVSCVQPLGDLDIADAINKHFDLRVLLPFPPLGGMEISTGGPKNACAGTAVGTGRLHAALSARLPSYNKCYLHPGGPCAMPSTSSPALTQTTTETVPADLTPGAIALMYALDRALLPRALDLLIARRDLDGIAALLGSDTVRNHPWDQLPFQMLPLRGDPDPRAATLAESAWEQMGEHRQRRLDAELLRIAQLNLRTVAPGTGPLAQLVQLVELGADVEAPIAPSNRTPIGQALVQTQLSTVTTMLEQFARSEPHRLPAARGKQDLLSFLIQHHADSVAFADFVAMLPRLFDFTNGTLADAPSSTFLKCLPGYMSPGKDVPSGIPYLAAAGVLNASAMTALWQTSVDTRDNSMAPADPRRRAPFIHRVARLSRADGKLASTILERMREAGVDLAAPFPDGSTALLHSALHGTPAFLSALLNGGYDVAAIGPDLARNAQRYAGAPRDAMALIHSVAASHTLRTQLGALTPRA